MKSLFTKVIYAQPTGPRQSLPTEITPLTNHYNGRIIIPLYTKVPTEDKSHSFYPR